MSDTLLEGTRILALIVLVWFGLVGWKLSPLGPRQKSHPAELTTGDR